MISTASLQRWLTLDGVKAMTPGAPRLEFGQAILRVVVSAAVLAYVAWYVGRDGNVTGDEVQALVAACAFFAFAGAITLRILQAPGISKARRILGIVVDNAVASYGLFVLGEGGAVILGTYLLVTVGNGLRYGRYYLHISHVLSVTGFSLVMLLSPYWSQHNAIGLGFLITLVVIPFYVGHLAKGIEVARQRADKANQAKGRFLANVSHEMRTPLNGVIAMADVLRETSLNESQREIVDTLGTSAHLLLAQIEDVLDMAKIEAGRVQIEQRPFDLSRLITSTIKVILPQARYKELTVNTSISADAARWFAGDAHHLRQVLLNLLANAVKFTERGEILLSVSLTKINESSATIRFAVKDTGIGISPEKQAVIFEPFTQADNSISRVYGGTGLGTTIARQLVTLMGGTMGLTSTVGVGSTFWFELPLPLSEPTGIDLTEELATPSRLTSEAAALAAQQPAKITKIRGARVLVAEDNSTNQRVTQLILESGGHRATIVANGELALDALERGNFDLALFDLSMPGVSGLEALKLYKYTTSKPIPVLILSANVTTEIIAECQNAGCAEFIAKPVRPSTLLNAIERHLAAAADEIAQRPALPRVEERPTLTVIDTPNVDLGVLDDLGRLSQDSTFVERLLNGFRSDVQRLVKAISDALATRRYEDVKDAAHALKGGAGSVGATQLIQLATRFEKAGHDVLRMKAAAWTEELARAADAAFAAFDKHLEERQRRSNS
jgi:two-component system, sensor histidine kinase RpfC